MFGKIIDYDFETNNNYFILTDKNIKISFRIIESKESSYSFIENNKENIIGKQLKNIHIEDETEKYYYDFSPFDAFNDISSKIKFWGIDLVVKSEKDSLYENNCIPIITSTLNEDTEHFPEIDIKFEFV